MNGSGYHFFAGVPLASVHLALRAPTSFVLEDDMFGFPLVLAILFCQSTRFAIALSADLGGLLMLMFAGSGAVATRFVQRNDFHPPLENGP